MAEAVNYSRDLADEAATVEIGREVGDAIRSGAVIYLEGQLGAGKTTFCRGLLHAFDYHGAVKSPTYTLVEPYELDAVTVYHFDLYRLGDPEELEYMGIRDYFDNDSICLVEWPERGLGVLPLPDIRVSITQQGSGRRLTLAAESHRGQLIISTMSDYESQ